MSLSISSAVRVPKVTTGLASNLQSLRSLNTPDIYSPQPTQIGSGISDTYGRETGRFGQMTETVGQNPLQRMVVEELVSRPEYSTYLNVPVGLMAGEDTEDYRLAEERNDGRNFSHYDTLTGRKNSGRNNGFGLYAGVFEFNPNIECQPGVDPTQCAQAKAAIITQRTNNNYDFMI